MVKHEKVIKLVGERVDTVNSQLARYETIKKWVIVENDFTLEGGELTPTLKVKRKVVTAKYKKILDGFYGD